MVAPICDEVSVLAMKTPTNVARWGLLRVGVFRNTRRGRKIVGACRKGMSKRRRFDGFPQGASQSLHSAPGCPSRRPASKAAYR